MSNDPMAWLDVEESRREEAREKTYFTLIEGDNRFVLLTHCAPLAQIWNQSMRKYEIAEKGEKGANTKGICWVWQEGIIKLARLPYTIVRAIRALQNNPDWEFEFPFPHVLTVNAKNAGQKEVEYALTASPKQVDIPSDILEQLKDKKSPEEMVDILKSKKEIKDSASIDYPGGDDVEINAL